CSDSVGYKLYPGYEFLKTIDYNLFLKEPGPAVFIFPVFLQVIGKEYPDFFSDVSESHKFLKKVAFTPALTKKVFALFDTSPGSERYIYMEPVVVRVDQIVRE